MPRWWDKKTIEKITKFCEELGFKTEEVKYYAYGSVGLLVKCSPQINNMLYPVVFCILLKDGGFYVHESYYIKYKPDFKFEKELIEDKVNELYGKKI